MKQVFTISLFVLDTIAMANTPLKIHVLDENKQPLTGVKLVEVKSSSTLYTDFDGVGELAELKDTKVYKIVYVGYESGFIKVSPNSNKEIEVILRKK